MPPTLGEVPPQGAERVSYISHKKMHLAYLVSRVRARCIFYLYIDFFLSPHSVEYFLFLVERSERKA